MTTQPSDELELLAPAEIAEAWHVSRRTVDRLIANGAIPVVRIGGCRRARLADLLELLDRGGTTTAV
jgi:excisionase family DNA binding protein